MQQEFIYKLIIPMNHVQLELGLSKELRSGHSSSYAQEAWEEDGPEQAGPHYTKSQEGRWSSGWEVACASPGVCSGSSILGLFQALA